MTETEVLRRFNRAWSQRVGLLEESYLGQGRTLGASRLLFEMGREGASVLDLRRRLGLDSGYLSRLLRGLEEEGLVAVRSDPADQRRRVAVPTAKGRRAIDRLDQRSEERALALVEPLGTSQRHRLQEALATADRLIRSATCTIEAVDVASDEAVAAVAPVLRRARRQVPRRLRPRGGDEHRPRGDEAARRLLPGGAGGGRGRRVRRVAAPLADRRRGEADVGRPRVARLRARRTSARGAGGRRHAGSATARSTSTPTAR